MSSTKGGIPWVINRHSKATENWANYYLLGDRCDFAIGSRLSTSIRPKTRIPYLVEIREKIIL